MPTVQYDVADRPLPGSTRTSFPVYWGLDASVADLDRAEPHFHARNVGGWTFIPHIEWPIHLGGLELPATIRRAHHRVLRQPDSRSHGTHFSGVPFVQHNALNRSDVEASLDIRPPAIERDFELNALHRELRHVIEPEIFYHYVTGINQAQQILQFDTADIATNTNEAGFSLTAALLCEEYPRKTMREPRLSKPRLAESGRSESRPHGRGCFWTVLGGCEFDPMRREPAAPRRREWASWQIAQKFFIDPTFGGALIPNRRNVFDSTLDLTGIAFLTSPRNVAPVISRLRFEAIDHLRVEWDLDYDPKAGRFGANNLFAGYSWAAPQSA